MPGGGAESRRVGWGRVSRWQFGGHMPPRPSVGQSQAPLTSPCPPFNHTITLNLSLTFAASWFGHASTYLKLTPAMAGVGRCGQNVWQVSAGVGRMFGRCRQVSAECLAGVGRCQHNVWQVSAGVSKMFGRCRQVSAKCLAGVGRCQQNVWQVSAGVKHVAGGRHAAHTHTHTHRQNMGIFAAQGMV